MYVMGPIARWTSITTPPHRRRRRRRNLARVQWAIYIITICEQVYLTGTCCYN